MFVLTSVGLDLFSPLFKDRYSLCFLKLETDDLSKVPIVEVLNNAINFSLKNIQALFCIILYYFLTIEYLCIISKLQT